MTEIGDHRVTCGDVMDGLADLMQGEHAPFVYTDPPWGQSALSAFATLNTKQSGAARRRIEFSAFLRRLFEELATYATGYLVIEYGITWRKQVRFLADEVGLTYLSRSDAEYRTGGGLRPMDVHLLTADPGLPNRPLATAGTFGMATVRAARELVRPGQVLLDPCCGCGNSARLAVETGAHFRGNEVNQVRLARTIKHLERSVTHAGSAA
jgi:hypothetical protein